MSMTRRQLLWSSAAGALALAVPTRRHRAAASPSSAGKNLIVVLAFGGWDTSYSIDPKQPGGAVDVPAGTIVTHGGIPVFEDPSRPSIGTYFTKYADITAIVSGAVLPGVSHRACLQHILTGARNETSPDAAAIVAHANSPDLPIPYLVLGDFAFAGPYAASMGRVGASNQIVGLLDARAAYPVDGRPAAFVPGTADEAAIRQYALARSDRERAVRGARGYNKRRVDDFVSSLARGDSLRGVRAGLGARGTRLDLTAQRTLALDAIQTGISRSIMLAAGYYFDTHEQNDKQGPNQDALFANLTALIDDLASRPGANAGSTMLDETVVAVLSEMGRTPKLNGGGGKDHWPVTSAMIIGGGVRGGRVYGGTTDTGQAQLVDFTTGDVSPTGRTIEPRHLVAGIVSACGVDPKSELPDAEVFGAFIA